MTGVPRESGVRHRVTAVALDGARAEGFVREADGVARPEGEYKIETIETSAENAPAPSSSAAVVVDLGDHDPAAPGGGKRRTRRPRGLPRPSATAAPAPPPSSVSPQASASAAPKPIGSVKDGFTKLR